MIRFRLLAVLFVLMAAWLTPASAALEGTADPRVKLSLEIANPVVKTGEPTKSYLKVGLIGRPDDRQRRPSVNVALVIDRSGSMSGEKIEHAKQAAMMFIDRLDPNDIISVIAYDSVVEVVIPATKITDREELRSKIMALEAGGNTALFAGVSKGAAEIRKFKDMDMASRMILLSDGLANVGPSSPDELAALGASLGREGVSIGTIGLGVDYNEDLMFKLATASDGAMAFAEHPSDLASFFDREIRAVTHVVASNIEIELNVKEPYKPVRVLGDRGTIRGQTVTFDLNQAYADWENYFIVEVELPGSEEEARKQVADCSLQYWDMLSRKNEQLQGTAEIAYVSNPEKASVNHEVLAQAVRLVAAENTLKAIKVRDAGDIGQAQQLLLQNAFYIQQNAVDMPQSYQQELAPLAEQSLEQSQRLDDEAYKASRKKMNTYSQGDMWQVMK